MVEDAGAMHEIIRSDLISEMGIVKVSAVLRKTRYAKPRTPLAEVLPELTAPWLHVRNCGRACSCLARYADLLIQSAPQPPNIDEAEPRDMLADHPVLEAIQSIHVVPLFWPECVRAVAQI